MTPYRDNPYVTCPECASVDVVPFPPPRETGWALRQMRELYPNAIKCLDCGAVNWEPENEKDPSTEAGEPKC